MISNVAAEAAGKALSLGERLTEEIQVVKVNIPFAGHTFQISETILMEWLVMVILIAGALVFARKMDTFPGKVQNFLEAVVDGVNSLAKDVLGHHWKHFSAYFGTILLFLVVSNTVGMFGIPGLRLPTKDISITLAMALMSILLVLGSQLRFKGIGGTFKSLFEPMWIIFPFRILDYFTRPLSLCLRLFGNIFGAFVMMELLILATRNFIVPPVFSLYFDIFDGLLQAFIFTFLSMLYVAEAIE